ncbi:MAG: hypothetical protein DME98_02035 [Verrucomicrobia bacterium]|nr:MAG: hypothetical protein DME98_02035 [Verrucomicrobiota bacterium]PYJ33341.1 MAG: hypothetical protein DME88_08520 [Verrucomicrobiota bacterium]
MSASRTDWSRGQLATPKAFASRERSFELKPQTKIVSARTPKPSRRGDRDVEQITLRWQADRRAEFLLTVQRRVSCAFT